MTTTMSRPRLFRRRFIPDETIELKKDEILLHNEDLIITKWSCIHPRNDFKFGYSCLFLKRGFKVSKFYTQDKKYIYTYCDIIEVAYDETENSYTIYDLLADVVIYPDGFVKVLDLDELPHALEKDLISIAQLKDALRKTDELLTMIYDGTITNFIRVLDTMIQENPI